MDTERARIYRLRDGTSVRCRGLRPSDRAKLLEGFEHFSPDSRYRRFFSPTPRLTPSMLARLFDLDGHDRVAIGAERLRLGVLGGPGVGVARFTRLPGSPDRAEIALSIVDDMQGRGLGTILLLELAVAARQHGVRRFVAWVQRDNEPMKALLEKLDPHAHARLDDGLLLFDLAVPETTSLVEDRSIASSLPPIDDVLGDVIGWCADGVRQLLPGRLVDAFARSRSASDVASPRAA